MIDSHSSAPQCISVLYSLIGRRETSKDEEKDHFFALLKVNESSVPVWTAQHVKGTSGYATEDGRGGQWAGRRMRMREKSELRACDSSRNSRTCGATRQLYDRDVTGQETTYMLTRSIGSFPPTGRLWMHSTWKPSRR